MQFVTQLQWPAVVGAKGLSWLWKRSRGVAVAAVVVVTVVKVRAYVQKQQRRKRWNAAGQDVVVLHMFQRARNLPNLSPYVLKLETYLRMADIKYEIDNEEPMGSKGKSPWITLNGQDLADSHFIMEHLGSKFNKDFSSHLSREEKAAAHSLRIMLENNTVMGLAYWRYVQDRGNELLTQMRMPFIVKLTIKAYVGHFKKALWLMGMGRHSTHDIEYLCKQDLAALSAHLGDKDFLTGDKPTEVDCAVFGFLCQLMYGATGSPYTRMVETDFPNLRSYTLRVKDKYWPDWNACLDPPQPAS